MQEFLSMYSRAFARDMDGEVLYTKNLIVIVKKLRVSAVSKRLVETFSPFPKGDTSLHSF